MLTICSHPRGDHLLAKHRRFYMAMCFWQVTIITGMSILELVAETLLLHLLLLHLHDLPLILLEYGLYLIFICLLVLMGIVVENLFLQPFLVLLQVQVLLGLANARANTVLCAHRRIHVLDRMVGLMR
jgi:hypothetical protein